MLPRMSEVGAILLNISSLELGHTECMKCAYLIYIESAYYLIIIYIEREKFNHNKLNTDRIFQSLGSADQ